MKLGWLNKANLQAIGRDITKIDDLWDPTFKGRVSMLSDTQDGLGMIMLSQGNSPAHQVLHAYFRGLVSSVPL